MLSSRCGGALPITNGRQHNEGASELELQVGNDKHSDGVPSGGGMSGRGPWCLIVADGLDLCACQLSFSEAVTARTLFNRFVYRTCKQFTGRLRDDRNRVGANRQRDVLHRLGVQSRMENKQSCTVWSDLGSSE